MQQEKQIKKRHVFVTIWLIFILIINAIVFIMNIFPSDLFIKSLHSPSKIILFLYSLLAFLNIIFVIMLLKWKKWAFWGFIATTLIGFFINLSLGHKIFSLIIGLLGIPILYKVLQIKKNNISTWNNLK